MKLEKVNDFIKSHSLLKEGATVIVGVSGGVDSMALLHYLWTRKQKQSLEIVVAHVDHMFRGQQSYDDLLFVKKYCKDREIKFVGKSIDVSAYAESKHMSSQTAARECRYQFYQSVIDTHQGDYLALAHHGDDQIETMLMRMVRGSYGRGVTGIPVQRPFGSGMLIRPFLCITKDEIKQYINYYDIPFREDPSNAKDDYQRNRFRHHMLPFLKGENPKVAERFQNLSQMLTEDEQLLETLAQAELEKILVQKGEYHVKFDGSALIRLPISLQRRCIHLILKYLYKAIPSNVSTIHINQVLSLLGNDHPSGQLNFPKGLSVRRSYHLCTIEHAQNGEATSDESFHYSLSVPGEVMVPGGYLIKAEWVTDISENIKGIDFVLCDSKNLSLPLHIRNRRSGDRMTLFGRTGTKKVKDIFIDEKVPRELRNSWPVIEDNQGNILWLPKLKKSGYSISHQGIIEGNQYPYLLLQYTTYNNEL